MPAKTTASKKTDASEAKATPAKDAPEPKVYRLKPGKLAVVRPGLFLEGDATIKLTEKEAARHADVLQEDA